MVRKFTPPLRVFVDAPGQTCNRFWAYLDTIAWTVFCNKKVYILHWDSSLRYFDALRKNPHVCFPFYCPRLFRLLGENTVRRIVARLFSNRVMGRVWRLQFFQKLGFVRSWPLRKSHEYFPLVKKELLPIFRPNDDISDVVDMEMSRYKEHGYFIIGIHIRRGDYKTWEGGKYYFEHTEYRDMMRCLVEVFKDRKVAFFISTNEPYDTALFEEFTLCPISGNTAAHDLYALSLCDRIIGPLSTFSRWASWYGDVPLAFFERGDTTLSEDSFSVISDFYHFENGREIVNLSDK